MTSQKSLPFEVGQLAEAKSFLDGFRSAWFRCKIKGITTRKKQTMHELEYYDYPDEKIKWTKLYQIPPKSSRRNQKKVKKELMVRPQFPLICRENEMPDINTISEVIVVVDGVWRVGDLVDWWKDDCFWSGTVIEIEGDDKVQIKLPEKPYGEGKTYSVGCKDLRPSLDWSPEYGWTIPTSMEIRNGLSCPRLIWPVKQDSLTKSFVNKADNDKQNVTTPRSSLAFNESSSSHTSTSSLPPSKGSLQSKDTSKKEMHQTHENMDSNIGGFAIGKPSCSDSVSSTYVRDVSVEVPEAAAAEEQYHANGSSKKRRLNETIPQNSTTCSSLESTIMDLEELVNRVKWLRRILKFGLPSNTPGPTWKLLEHPALSPPK